MSTRIIHPEQNGQFETDGVKVTGGRKVKDTTNYFNLKSYEIFTFAIFNRLTKFIIINP